LTLNLGAPSTVTTHPKAKNESSNYYFLYPRGHLGLTAVTFFFILPLTQMIVFSFGLTDAFGFAAAGAVALTVGVGLGVPAVVVGVGLGVPAVVVGVGLGVIAVVVGVGLGVGAVVVGVVVVGVVVVGVVNG
jgi:hypothetical protein